MRYNLNINYTFILLFLLVIIPLNLKPYFIALFGISVIYNAIVNKIKFNKKFFLNHSLLYIGLSITLCYTENISFGLTMLERMSSLIVFPFIFSFVDSKELKKIRINKCIWLYIVCIFLFHMAVYLWFASNYFSPSDTLVHFQEIVTNKIGKFSTHPIYLSMHCCVGIFLSFKLLKKENKKITNLLVYFFQLCLVSFLVLHAKKGPIISFIITSLCYFIIFKKNINFKTFALLFLSGILIIFSVPKLNKRFKEVLKIEKLSVKNENSTNIRFAVYNSALKTFKKSPIIGFGIGDSELALISDYTNHILRKKNYNSHNQYLSFLLVGGPAILLLYFIYFIKHIKIGVKSNNKMYVILLIFYSIVMLTENILEREDGVIFFSLFLSYFGLKHYLNFEKK